jgi:hypothetical protein
MMMDPNEQHALDHPISGPIVACDNAIEHYIKAYDQQTAVTDQLRRKLAASLDAERTLDGMLRQWMAAKTTLETQAQWDKVVPKHHAD